METCYKLKLDVPIENIEFIESYLNKLLEHGFQDGMWSIDYELEQTEN